MSKMIAGLTFAAVLALATSAQAQTSMSPSVPNPANPQPANPVATDGSPLPPHAGVAPSTGRSSMGEDPNRAMVRPADPARPITNQ